METLVLVSLLFFGSLMVVCLLLGVSIITTWLNWWIEDQDNDDHDKEGGDIL